MEGILFSREPPQSRPPYLSFRTHAILAGTRCRNEPGFVPERRHQRQQRRRKPWSGVHIANEFTSRTSAGDTRAACDSRWVVLGAECRRFKSSRPDRVNSARILSNVAAQARGRHDRVPVRAALDGPLEDRSDPHPAGPLARRGACAHPEDAREPGRSAAREEARGPSSVCSFGASATPEQLLRAAVKARRSPRGCTRDAPASSTAAALRRRAPGAIPSRAGSVVR